MVAVDGEHRQPYVEVGVGKVDQPAAESIQPAAAVVTLTIIPSSTHSRNTV
jgi:hypothetical protein